MNYRRLGRTGLEVSELCLGAMMFGSWGNRDHDDCVGIVHRAFDAGVNFIDTADTYSQGESEEIVGKAIAGRRAEVVLATKVHGRMGPHRNDQGSSRRWIITEVENSLRRLGTDHIDLYQVHRPDPTVDIDETLGALSDLVRAGKVLHIGSSKFPAHLVVEAQWAAQRRNLERFVCEQPPYSMLVRGIEADVLPVAASYGIGVISWSPLAGGYLSGRFRAGIDPGPSHRDRRRRDRGVEPGTAEDAAKRHAAERLAEVADDAGLTMVELALGFVLNHPAITSAIVGPRTREQLEGQLSAPDVVLTADVLDRIDEIVPPGTNIDLRDTAYAAPGLLPHNRRR